VRAGRALVLWALLSAPGTVAAQVQGDVALLSDYRFRGESLTEGRPALQAGVNYDHSSGLFVGGLVSNVRIDPDVVGLSAQIYGGYTRPIGERAAWDVGLVTYVFPHPSMGGPGYDYTEVFVGTSFDRLSSRLYYTNSYFGGGQAIYLELNGSHAINDRITVVGHVGYLGLSQTREPTSSGERDNLVDFLAGINFDISGFVLGLSIVGTNAQQNACPAGTGRCNTTGVVSISHKF
jgi:uncharacterized protein (TIGR02001 family)